MAVDYFSKWIEAELYTTVGSKQMVRFIERNIIYRYELPHHVVTDNGVQFRAEIDTLLKEYKMEHHSSSSYSPQENGPWKLQTRI